MTSSNKQMQELIKSLYTANDDYWQLMYDEKSYQILEDPASEEDLRQYEQEINVMLPPSYKEFLLLHDGWKNFTGEACILGTKDRGENKGLADTINEFNASAIQEGDLCAGNGFVIMAGEGVNHFVYLNFEKQNLDGEFEVVEIAYPEGELNRFPDFTSFLQHKLEVMLELIKLEKGEIPIQEDE
jgi:hypothetical protein